MKAFGFIKEHSKYVVHAVEFAKIEKQGKSTIPNVHDLINYMKQAHNAISMLHSDFDIVTGEKISAHNIKTDGEWLWPEYCPYYLEKGYCIDIPKDFIDHLEANNYMIPELTESLHKKMIKLYYEITNQQLPRGMKFD